MRRIALLIAVVAILVVLLANVSMADESNSWGIGQLPTSDSNGWG